MPSDKFTKVLACFNIKDGSIFRIEVCNTLSQEFGLRTLAAPRAANKNNRVQHALIIIQT